MTITLNGLLYSDATIFTANSVILASKLTNKIPQVIPNLFRSVLSYTGLICLPFQFHDLTKNFRDLTYSIKLKEMKAIAHTALKISLRVMEIFLLIAGSAAVFLLLTPLAPVSTLIFNAMIPFALPCFFLPLGLDCIDTREDKMLLKLLDDDFFLEKATKGLRKYFEREREPKNSLTLTILKQCTPYTLNELKQNLSKESLKTALKTRLVVSNIDITLKGIGQVGMAIGRLYPNSLAQAASIWCISLLYNIKHFYERGGVQSLRRRCTHLLGKKQSIGEE